MSKTEMIDGEAVDTQTGEARLPAVIPQGGATVPQPRETELTSEQARINTVYRVIDAAMARASMLEITPEQSAALLEDFPDEAFRKGAAGDDNLIYIEHANLRERFLKVFGIGQWAIILTRPYFQEEFKYFKDGKQAIGFRVYADCALLVKGCLVGQATGDAVYYPSNTKTNFSDAAEGAKSTAFRRCAKEFGVGLQAWRKDWGEGWWLRNPGGRRAAPKAATEPESQVNPAQGLADYISVIGGMTADELEANYGEHTDKKATLMVWKGLYGNDGVNAIAAAIKERREWFAKAKAKIAVSGGLPADRPVNSPDDLGEVATGVWRMLQDATNITELDAVWAANRKDEALTTSELRWLAAEHGKILKAMGGRKNA